MKEEALRLSSAYNRSLIEASLDPLVTIGPDGKITDVNAATEAATGRSRPELIGTHFCDYFTEPARARAGYEQAFRDGSVRDYVLDLRHRDGSVRSVLYNASVYRDEARHVIGVFAAARDVTERKQADERASRLAAIVESSEDAILSKTLEGVIASWNKGAEKIYGYTAEEVVGKPISLLRIQVVSMRRPNSSRGSARANALTTTKSCAAQGRDTHRPLTHPLPNPGSFGPNRWRFDDRSRHHRTQADGGRPAANRRSAAQQRSVPGGSAKSDPHR